MFSPFERMVAMRYLRARRKEGFISVIAAFSLLGIALGVATLIIVMSVMNGFRHDFVQQIVGFNGDAAIQPAAGPLTDYEEVAKAIRGLPMVKAADPLVQGQAMITNKQQAKGVFVRGIRPEDLKAKRLVADSIVLGNLDEFAGTDVIILGRYLAQDLGVTVGDQVTLIAPNSVTTMVGMIPRIKSYRVVGIFAIGNYLYDDNWAFMPLEAAQLYFRYPQSATQIEVTVDDPDRVGPAIDAILARIGGDYRVIDWQQANASYFGAIQVERNVMFLILTLIIVVAAFNIISGQIMLVKDKGRDIAILRTMGATRGMIMRIFLLSGASIGVVGTAAGFALGLAFAENIEAIRQFLQGLLHTRLFPAEVYFLSRLPAIVEPGEVATVVIMSLVLCLLATLYPSWRAARLDPVEALRYE